MRTEMDPEEINVIVHSCKDLHVRKKGKSKFSVIFGVGSNKFRTAVVEDALGLVVWNEESTVSVDNNDHPLLFVVTDKDHVLGQVSVPLETITLSQQKYDAPLRPHKKNKNSQGELSFSCWVSKYATATPADSVKQTQKLSKTASLSKLLTGSPLFKRKDKSKSKESHISNQQYSVSMLDVKHPSMEKVSSGGKSKSHFLSNIDLRVKKHLPRLKSKSSPKTDGDARMSTHGRLQSSPKFEGEFSRPRSNSQESFASSSSGFASYVDPTESTEGVSQGAEVNSKERDAPLCLTKVLEESLAPEVTGISPKEGPTSGLTRLTIRGTNLGVNTPDVVGLYVCGSNCLSTLEYVSPNKLHCTTKAWRPGSGDVIIVTQSGGRGKCCVQFTFVEPPTAPEPEPVTAVPYTATETQGSTETGLLPHKLNWDKQHVRKTPISTESNPLPQRFDHHKQQEESSTASASPSPRNSSPRITVHNRREINESSASSASRFVSYVDQSESTDRISQESGVSAENAPLCLTKVREETLAPEVTGISPKEGPTSGLTRLTIRGTNLGVNTPDVVGLYVCGSNCLSTLEYVSPNKLHCTTKTWRAGSGDVIIVTQSGGRGKCCVQFTFVEPPTAPEPEPVTAVPYTATEIQGSIETGPLAHTPYRNKQCGTKTPVSLESSQFSKRLDVGKQHVSQTPGSTESSPLPQRTDQNIDRVTVPIESSPLPERLALDKQPVAKTPASPESSPLPQKIDKQLSTKTSMSTELSHLPQKSDKMPSTKTSVFTESSPLPHRRDGGKQSAAKSPIPTISSPSPHKFEQNKISVSKMPATTESSLSPHRFDYDKQYVSKTLASAESSPSLQRFVWDHQQEESPSASATPSPRNSSPALTVRNSGETNGLLAGLSGNNNLDIKDDTTADESEPPPFRKRGSIRDTSIRYSKETLMTEIKRLRDENKALKEKNDAMTVYIDRLVTKVILHCPELLGSDLGSQA